MRHRYLAISVALVALVLALYYRTIHFDFVSWDDSDYILQNPHVREGIGAETLKWAFVSTRAANWHPLTWMSHMLDWRLYGLRAGGHHATNVILHAVNTLLLLAGLRRLTGRFYESAFVAALFAIHPLHVESVAWVSERKDVLSSLFGFAALAAYARYAESPGWRRYLTVLVLYAGSLLCKPMWVTLPFLLLLLDWWPLGRVDLAEPGKSRRLLGRLVLEKVPLLALAAASSLVTFWVQRISGAMATTIQVPPRMRLQDALVSYVDYLRQTFWPTNLSYFYPLPVRVPPLTFGLPSLAILVAITVAVLRARQRHPYLVVGWLWFLGTLVPVIGLVQVGSQIRADRYTYMPLIGIFIMVTWGALAFVSRKPARRSKKAPAQSSSFGALGVVAVLAVAALVPVTWAQVGYWRDTTTLFERAIRVTRDNDLAETNYGWAMMNEGRLDEALVHFKEALRIRPTGLNARFDIGQVLMRKGQVEEALGHYRAVLESKPNYADAHSELGAGLARLARLDEAIEECRKALEINPRHAGAYNNLGVALAMRGDTAGAMENYRKAIELNQDYSEARNNLGALLARTGRFDEAVAELRMALRIQPGYVSACNNLVRALYLDRKYPEAWREVKRCEEKGVDLEPRFVADLTARMARPEGDR